MIWEVFGDVLPQAVGVAISPVPIILVILILVSARARTNGPAFALGWYAAVFGAVSIYYLLADGADVTTDETAADGMNVVQIGLGLLFFYLGIRAWQKRPRRGMEVPQSKLFSAVDSMSLPIALGTGALFAVVNAKNMPIQINVGGTIAESGIAGGDAIAVIALFAFVASLSVIVPVGAMLLLGERARGPLDAVKDWLLANNAAIMLVIFLILGAKMLGKGLALFS